MKIVRPAAIADAQLISSSVPETAPAAWSNATTYANGAQVSIVTGTRCDVYTSQLNANLNHAPATSPTWWTLAGVTYLSWAVGTTYAKGDLVLVVGADSHHLYESLQAANTGHAVTDTAWWLDRGATNRWAMFDASVSTQTTNPSSIRAVLKVDGRADSLAAFNLAAAQARVTMTDAVEGVVYDRSVSLVSDSGITDWYRYLFEPIERLTDLVLTDLPPYAGAQISVELTDPGATVACGACVVGLSREVGSTQYGVSLGIQDYSLKQADDFGDFTVVKRAFAKRASFTVWVENSFVDRLQALLANYRATPVVFVGTSGFASTAVLGFYKDFSTVISYPDVSVLSLEVEGLA